VLALPTIGGEGPLTMSSREIAELTGVRHDNAMVVIKDLVNKGTIKLPEIQEVSTGSRGPKAQLYLLDRRSSLILAGRLSVDFMATVFDRWDELETAAAPTLAAPHTDLAQVLQLLATLTAKVDALALAQVPETPALPAPEPSSTAALNRSANAIIKCPKRCL
jgi:phage regulator Rha-like protein